VRLLFRQPHKWLQAPKARGSCSRRDEATDRTWNTIATEGWEDNKIRAERFQRIGSSNVPALVRPARVHRMANQIGMERIESAPPHGQLHPEQMIQRGASSWTSPMPYCASGELP
jgi:hypothetical protein